MDNSPLPTHTTPLKILIIEDNVIIQMAEKYLFESLKLQADVAENGEKAIAFFKPGKYVLVLIDIGLPDISGYEVYKRLIAMEKSTAFHVPIIGISAHASMEENDLCFEADMEEILSKPLLLEAAKALLQRYGILNLK